MREDDFYQRIESSYGPFIEDTFDATIVDVGNLNQDGSDRLRILQSCECDEVFDLVPETGTAAPPESAVAVTRRHHGPQVGRLPEATSRELLPRMQDPDSKWMAVLRRIRRREDDGEIIGADVLVMRMVGERLRNGGFSAAGPRETAEQHSPRERSCALLASRDFVLLILVAMFFSFLMVVESIQRT